MDQGSYLMGMTFLARACTKAFSSGSSSSDGRASLSQHFPGCCLLSISVPSMASKSLLVTAGNMARDHEMRITFLGMHAAAAGLALQERRWFHISKASASRLAKYEDLRQACEGQECEQILCVPILPQLPSGHTGRAGRAQPPRSAFGVLTLGFDDSVTVDARLLTSTFLLAHLMAQDLIRQAPAMLMRVQSMPAGPRSPSKRPPDAARDSSSPGRALGSSLRGPSFPAKRMREPASFANGVFKPELKPMYPSNSESSQQVSAPVKRQMFAPLPYRTVPRCPGDPAPPWHAYKG